VVARNLPLASELTSKPPGGILQPPPGNFSSGGNSVATITEPGSDGFGPRVTRFQYNEAGRLVRTDLPDGSSRHQEYHPNGAIKRQWGSQQYPVGYEYDAQGRVTTQSTWQGFDPATGNGTGTPALTRWVYDPQTGQLQQKQHADGKGPTYAYTPGGRLASRTWARGVSTVYAYGADGMMASLDHSDSTPDVSFSYTRSGQLDTVEDAVSGSTRFTHSYTYSPIGQLTTETSDTTVERTLTRIYETGSSTAGRFLGWDLGSEGSAEAIHWQRYGYDGAGRLNAVSSPAGVGYVYQYLDRSSLIESIRGPVHEMRFTYEGGRNLATSRSHFTDDMTISRYETRHDRLGRRENQQRTGAAFAGYGASFSRYGYDELGQLTDDKRYPVDSPDDPATLLEEQSFAFTHDGIGNRLSAKIGNDLTVYTPNTLNQYISIGTMQPVHDADGNLIFDGNSHYHWDAENRLILVEPVVATEGTKRLEFQYDYIGRRVSKQVWTRTGGAWVDENTTAFVYDGWNLISEISNLSSGFQSSRNFTWGIDLSGSIQGAGGVGGLLAQTHSDSRGSQTFHYTYDLNGNVSEVLDESGTIAAHYEYGPFGEVLVESFDSDSVRRILGEGGFRFSTKYRDAETGLLYYGYRYYDPTHGRWLNRDPIEESGGLNLYGFVGNDPVNGVDVLGMSEMLDGLYGYRYLLYSSAEYRAQHMHQQEVYARVYGQWIQDARAAAKAGADMANFLLNPAYDGIREEYLKKLKELAAKLALDPCLRRAFLREIQSDVDAAWADLLDVTPEEREELLIGAEFTILTGALSNSLRAVRGPSFIGKVNKYIDKFTLDKRGCPNFC
jgi:RHS repeat-associated protein